MYKHLLNLEGYLTKNFNSSISNVRSFSLTGRNYGYNPKLLGITKVLHTVFINHSNTRHSRTE